MLQWIPLIGLFPQFLKALSKPSARERKMWATGIVSGLTMLGLGFGFDVSITEGQIEALVMAASPFISMFAAWATSNE